MSEHIDEAVTCDAVQEDLAAIALGIASGRRRAEVLRHVEHCPRCSAELEQLSIISDTLLQLAPEVEPPIGFELRLAARLRESAGPREVSHWRRASVWALAAVLIVVVGLGVGSLIGTGHRNPPTPAVSSTLTSAALIVHGSRVGEAIVSAGNPSWMYMSIDRATWSGAVTCQVVLADGHVETVGRFELTGGYGAWGAPLWAAARDVRSARLVTAGGVVLATARFATPA